MVLTQFKDLAAYLLNRNIMLFILLLCVLTIFVLLYLFLTWNFNYWTKQGVPGPKPTVLIGSFPGVFTQKENIVYDIDRIYKLDTYI